MSGDHAGLRDGNRCLSYHHGPSMHSLTSSNPLPAYSKLPASLKGYLPDFGMAVGLILLINAVWLWVDPILRIYMGDSMVFLQSTVMRGSAAERSYLYGLALFYLHKPFASAQAILAFNLLCAMLTSLALFGWLRVFLRLPLWICLTATALFCSEPAQVFMARMVMAETFGLAALIGTFGCLAFYLRTANLLWFLLAVLMGLAAAALRTNFLPLVLGMSLVAALLCLFEQPRHRARFGRFAAALALLVATHIGYTHWYGRAVGQPAGYVAHTGMMAIGLVAPLIKPEHFEGTGVSGEILKKVSLPLNDHWQRGNHIWSPKGLWAELSKASPNAEMVARTVTRRAMLSDPIGLLKINVATLGGYFNQRKSDLRMQDDIGVIAPDPYAIQVIRTWFNWDVSNLSRTESPARAYFKHAATWFKFCLFALLPLALASMMIGWRRAERTQYLLLGFTSLGLLACHLLFVHIVSYRYLHPLPWFVLAHLAIIASWLLGRLPTKDPQPQDRPASSSHAGHA